jgi:hypothetical protein
MTKNDIVPQTSKLEEKNFNNLPLNINIQEKLIEMGSYNSKNEKA